MVICPVAIAVGCKKCPIFKICPATRVIGDQKAEESKTESKPATRPANATKAASGAKSKKR